MHRDEYVLTLLPPTSERQEEEEEGGYCLKPSRFVVTKILCSVLLILVTDLGRGRRRRPLALTPLFLLWRFLCPFERRG